MKVSIEAAMAQVEGALLLVKTGVPEEVAIEMTRRNLEELARQGK